MDRDAQALEIARERLKDYERQVTLVQADFSRIDEVVQELGLAPLQRRAGRPGRFQHAAGHRGARLFLPARGTSGHANGFG